MSSIEIISMWIDSARNRKKYELLGPLFMARDILEGVIIYDDHYIDTKIPEIKSALDAMPSQEHPDLLQVRGDLAKARNE
jgi:hypothetical protein